MKEEEEEEETMAGKHRKSIIPSPPAIEFIVWTRIEFEFESTLHGGNYIFIVWR